MSDDDFGTGISVITIVLDPVEMAPRINLGDIPPHIAIAIFNKAIEALEASIPYPTIEYQGRVIASDMYSEDEWDD